MPSQFPSVRHADDDRRKCSFSVSGLICWLSVRPNRVPWGTLWVPEVHVPSVVATRSDASYVNQATPGVHAHKVRILPKAVQTVHPCLADVCTLHGDWKYIGHRSTTSTQHLPGCGLNKMASSVKDSGDRRVINRQQMKGDCRSSIGRRLGALATNGSAQSRCPSRKVDDPVRGLRSRRRHSPALRFLSAGQSGRRK